MKKSFFALDLRLFDGSSGAGGGAAAGGDGGAAGAMGAENAAGTQEVAALEEKRLKRHPLANVRYGRQPEAPKEGGTEEPAVAGQEETPPVEGGGETFEELISGRYKQEFGERVQQILAKRLKNSRDAEERLGKLGPMLEALGEKYGVGADDIDGLVARVTDDDSLYEAEAQQRGVPVSTLKQIKALERDKAEADRFRAQSREQAAVQAHYQRLVEQGQKVKEMFPTFDLQTELKNPDFLKLTAPGVGVDVMTAYQVIHRDEIQPAAMQYAARKTQEKLAASIQANASRPVENGVGATGAQAEVRMDPSKWSKEDRAEVRRRVARGERIEL